MTDSLGMTKCTETNVGELSRITRVTMTKYNHQYRECCIERLYLTRKKGGREWTKKNATWETRYKNRSNYITKAGWNYTPSNQHARTQVPIHNQDAELIQKWSFKFIYSKHIYLIQAEIPAISITNYRKCLLKDTTLTIGKYRSCNINVKTIDHILQECTEKLMIILWIHTRT